MPASASAASSAAPAPAPPPGHDPSPPPAAADRWTLLYYVYADLTVAQRAEAAAWLEANAARLGLRGRIRVGLDGLNAAIGGTRAALQAHSEAVQVRAKEG